MVSQKCSSEQGPLLKILAHAAKFPSGSISGVLLGTAAGGESSDVFIQDVVPLCHTSATLAPALETGISMAEAYTQQPGSAVSIVGYYYSDARFTGGPSELAPVAKRVADRISDLQPAGVVLVLDNKKLSALLRGDPACPFDLYCRDGSKSWKRAVPTGGSGGGDGAALSALELVGGSWKGIREEFFSVFKTHHHRSLVDFEEHLDDINKDFLNPGWVKKSKFTLPGQAL